MKISGKIEGIERVRASLLRLPEIGGRALAATAEDAEAYAEAAAAKHNVTGALVRSLLVRRDGPAAFEVLHDLQAAPHALFVHWGTKPHKIKPRRKRALRWAAGGRFFFAAGVMHPGYRGDAWMARAAREVPKNFERHVQARIAAYNRST